MYFVIKSIYGKNNNTTLTAISVPVEPFEPTPLNRTGPRQTNFIEENKIINTVANDIDVITSWNGAVRSSLAKMPSLNPNFLNLQFHNDYRDIITAINNLVPEKKQKFNLANIPLKYSQPEVSEIKDLITDFIYVLNDNIKNEVPNVRNIDSGWDEAIPDPNIVSGWAKAQAVLNLPASLYEEPVGRNKVNLIKVRQVQKYETDDEIKYSIDFVIQKDNVSDQMILKGDFVQDMRPLNDENNFFINKKIKTQVIIEDIFVIGYLSKEGNNDLDTFKPNEYYNYNKMEYNDLTDPKYIQKILLEKYKQNTLEMDQRNALLDEEGQAFHRDLPNMYDSDNIKGTRTIFQDMNEQKVFY